jgi:RNA polymerase sigma-70 factor, ECF subfamily
MDGRPVTHDQPWFMAQVAQHQARLRASIRALGVRAEAVDDIAQDTFLLAWKKLAEFGSGGDFGLWVAQIARRLIANERRKDARRSRLLEGEVTDVLLLMASEEDKTVAWSDKADEFAVLRSCLEELPRHAREVIRLRYFENQSPGAIASHLGRPSDAVRQLLLRLRRKLLECVESRLGLESG